MMDVDLLTRVHGNRQTLQRARCMMPEPLQDHKGTDMPATRGIVIAIVAVAVIALIGYLIIRANG
jgi:hypothetical protein